MKRGFAALDVRSPTWTSLRCEGSGAPTPHTLPGLRAHIHPRPTHLPLARHEGALAVSKTQLNSMSGPTLEISIWEQAWRSVGAVGSMPAVVWETPEPRASCSCPGLKPWAGLVLRRGPQTIGQQNPLEGLLKHTVAPPQSFWSRRSGVGPENLHFQQGPSSADAAGPGIPL